MARERLSWEEIERLVEVLADQIRESGTRYDCILGIARGGLIPATLLARRLGITTVYTMTIKNYREGTKQRLPKPLLVQAPPEPSLFDQDVLVVDDIWDSGTTIALARKFADRVAASVSVATLHFKPKKTVVDGHPDFCGAETDAWIEYPWEEQALV